MCNLLLKDYTTFILSTYQQRRIHSITLSLSFFHLSPSSHSNMNSTTYKMDNNCIYLWIHRTLILTLLQPTHTCLNAVEKTYTFIDSTIAIKSYLKHNNCWLKTIFTYLYCQDVAHQPTIHNKFLLNQNFVQKYVLKHKFEVKNII